MKLRSLSILLAVILIETGVILNLGNNIHKKISRTASVTPLNKDSLIFISGGQLKYFYEPKPNASDIRFQPDWLQDNPKYTINSDTLNERFNYSVEKGKNIFRIITLGNSFVYGLFVNTKDNWTEKLEEELNNNCKAYLKYEVINLGMPGYDIRYEAERFKRRGQKYNPDLVLWLLKYDEFDDIRDKTQPMMDEDVAKKVPQDSSFWENIHQRLVTEYGANQIEAYQRQSMQEISNYYKGNLLIFSMSDLFQSHYIDNRKIVEDFKSSRAETNFYLMNSLNRNELFPDGHPNVLGQQFISSNLFDYLIKSKLIKCN